MKSKKALKSSVSSKGQVTIPKEIRQRLGLGPGVEIHFEVVDGAAVLTKAANRSSAIWQWVGYFQREGIDFPYKDSLDAVAHMRGRGD